MDQSANPARPPAIGLIVVGVINVLLGLLGLLSFVMRLTGQMPESGEDRSTAYRVGEIAGQLVFITSLIAAPFIIKGALDMFQGRKMSSAKLAAILAMIPMTSCCFLIGVPFGIWALVVLKRPEVKTFFEQGPGDSSPPPPPQYH